MKYILSFLLLIPNLLQAHGISFEDGKPQPVFVDLNVLKGLGIPTLMWNDDIQVGYTFIDEKTANLISSVSHQMGKCGPFYVIPEEISYDMRSVSNELNRLSTYNKQLQSYSISFLELAQPKNEQISNIIEEVSPNRLRSWVQWLSSFQTRHSRGDQRNNHVEQLKERLTQILAESQLNYEIDLVTHTRTAQHSLRVRLTGSEYPNEIVVIGGHLDSISQFSSQAPGADDNASGSANIAEALFILAQHNLQPKRTVEFYWYAAEELGLIGSGEIAKSYKQQQKDVVSVLQLDMTAYPGQGVNRIGNVTDFTHPWLQAYLKQIVGNYLPHVEVYDFKCGYGCSDHASWFNEGFPAFTPFEATMNNMNRRIHTANDIIGNILNFEHSAIFSKIALAYILDMGNSRTRVP